METRVITIARQVGTGGEDVAGIVAAATGYRLLDYRVVQEAAQEAGVSPETVSDALHKPSFFARIIEALARNPATPASGQWGEPINIAATPLLTSVDYRQLIQQVIDDFANQGRVVLLGHGAQFILKNRQDTLRVLVSGTVEARTSRLMTAMATDQAKARELVQRTDKERIDYFRSYYGEDWLGSSSYDLIVNTDRLDAQQAAEVILATVRVRAPLAASV
ncbi:MAG: cytidylate kinase-like family protein [Dehalococcoidia bacterium]|nr:cytidylate kinase-like family protein [Dehalococcoidia bacterium]